jgi:hypothetical protein
VPAGVGWYDLLCYLCVSAASAIDNPDAVRTGGADSRLIQSHLPARSRDVAAQGALEQYGIEVHQQRDVAAAEAKIRARLRLVHRQDALDGRGFQENGAGDDDVGEVALVLAHVFVNDGEGNLVLEFQVGVLQLPAKAVAIDRLEQSRAELAVHLDREANDAVGQDRAGFVGLVHGE